MSGFLWAHGAMLALGVTLVLGFGALAVGALGWLMPAARSVVVRQRVCELSVVAGLVWLVVASVPLPRVGTQNEIPRGIVAVSGPRATPRRLEVEIPPELIARPAVVKEVPAAVMRPGETPKTGVTVAAPTAVAAPFVELRSGRIDWRVRLAKLFVVGAGVCVGWLVLGRVVLWWMIRGSRVAPVEVMKVLKGEKAPFGSGDGDGGADESGAARGTSASSARLSSPKSVEPSRCSRGFAPACLTQARWPRVWVTPGLGRPVTFGVWRPVVLLPESLLEAECGGQLRQVLLHELGHIEQGDGWGNLLFCAGLPVLYWNPLYWWLRGRSSLLRELVADDWAARADGKEAYATELVALARTRVEGWAGAMGAIGILQNRSDFYRRMRMLLQRQNPLATGCSTMCRAALAVVTLAVVVGMGATVGVTPARGQTADADPAARPGSAPDVPAKSERLIQVDDVLTVSRGAGDAGTPMRVNARGNVYVAPIGSIKAAGLTSAELEKAIAQKLRDANLVNSDGPLTVTFGERTQAVAEDKGGAPQAGDAPEDKAPVAELAPVVHQKSDALWKDLQKQIILVDGQPANMDAVLRKYSAAMAKEIGKFSDAQIGMLDPQLRKLLDERTKLEARVKQLQEQGYGAQHPEMVRARAQLTDIEAKVQKYAREWRDLQLKMVLPGGAEVARKGAPRAGGEASEQGLASHGAIGGVQLDVVSLANSTVEAAGAVRVAKAELASKRRMKENGVLGDLEREEANLETAARRLELLKGIAGIALDGATQELERAKQLYQQGAESAREVSDAQTRVKMLELIVKSAG